MTIQEIKQEIEKPDYDFLRTNPHLKNQLCMLTLGGSYAYGLNTETSDVDIRGFAIETQKDLYLNQNFEQIIDNKTDTTIYSLQKLTHLLSQCNPNVIEILGCKKDQYLYLNPIGEQLIKNRHLFLSQKAFYTFSGYASMQLRRLNNKTSRVLSQEEQELHILQTLKNALPHLVEKYPEFENAIAFHIDASNHDDRTTEIYVSLNLNRYPIRDLHAPIETMTKIVVDFDRNSKRNQQAIAHNKLAKHMTHLIRLYMMCIDILTNHEIITYREKEHDFLMSIRNGEMLDKNQQPKPEFFQYVVEYEKKMQEALDTTSLPKEPDKEAIDNLLYDIYSANL